MSCRNFITYLMLAVVLSGCSMVSKVLYKSTNSNESSIAGAGEIFHEPSFSLFKRSKDGFTTIQYCRLLKHYGLLQGEIELDESSDGYIIDFCQVKNDFVKSDKQEFSLIRDEIQDRVLAASNQKCGYYMKSLYSLKGDTEVFWGGLSTLLSGAGAVLPHASTAKAFAAGGAATSGIRSELEQAYFANKAIEVITAGIEVRRNEILEEIMHKRFLSEAYFQLWDPGYDINKLTKNGLKKSPKSNQEDINNNELADASDEEVKAEEGELKTRYSYTPLGVLHNKNNEHIHHNDVPTRYPLNGAIRDALAYHAACSTITGLEVAAESIARIENPGVAEFHKFLKKMEKAGIKATVELNQKNEGEE